MRKPGAFTNYRYREELYPTVVFRRVYDALVEWRGERAYVDYVQILHLAARNSQIEVETALELLLDAADRFGFADVETLVKPGRAEASAVITAIQPHTPSLQPFDELLSGECHACLKAELPVAC